MNPILIFGIFAFFGSGLSVTYSEKNESRLDWFPEHPRWTKDCPSPLNHTVPEFKKEIIPFIEIYRAVFYKNSEILVSMISPCIETEYFEEVYNELIKVSSYVKDICEVVAFSDEEFDTLLHSFSYSFDQILKGAIITTEQCSELKHIFWITMKVSFNEMFFG